MRQRHRVRLFRSHGFYALVLGLGSVVLAATAPEPVPKVHTTTNTTYYEVEGGSSAMVGTQINSRGPVGKDDGAIHAAVTNYDIKWKYKTRRQEDGFAIVDLLVSLDLACIMPRKKPSQKIGDAFESEWKRFLAALTVHERGHVEHDVRMAEGLLAKLGERRRFKSVEELKAFVEAESSRCLAECAKANVDYDRRTNHGATQGATLR